MIDASEARRIAGNYKPLRSKVAIDVVETKIREAASYGLTECRVKLVPPYDKSASEVRQELRLRGFSVQHLEGTNDWYSYVTLFVSW